MKMFLHTPLSDAQLAEQYRTAFQSATELYVVTAYLTEWDESLKLNSGCKDFRLIIGKDFGITRKAACEKVIAWLPKGRKTQFLVADAIAGFHPKAIFWKDKNGNCFHIIGSSNLTRAAFETNYEANIYGKLSSNDFTAAKAWIREIEQRSVAVSDDWLSKYKEAKPSQRPGGSQKTPGEGGPVIALDLPEPDDMETWLTRRRRQLRIFEEKKVGLTRLFKSCAEGRISNKQFYTKLPNYWGYDVKNRIQGRGWERKGAESDFRDLSRSYMAILAADDQERDNVVCAEIDRLHQNGNSARRAFLSEMLCLRFPSQYPILNRPVWAYLDDIEFHAPRGSTEGEAYIDLAKKLRLSLLQNPKHPAKNLAELDTVIWLQYG